MAKRIRGNFNPELIQGNLRQGDNNVVQMFGGGAAPSGYPLLYDAYGNAIARQPRGNTTVVQLADSTTNPVSGNAAAFDGNGNIKDAGVAPAQTSAATAHKFLSAYNSVTGAFTQAQPADADLAVSDITTNNVSTSAHGFAPKAPNDATKYLDGTGAYSTPTPATATTSVLGIVKPDGTTIDISAGVISVPTATTSLLGLVKPDGATILDSSGAISVPTASTSTLGLVKVDGSTITISGGVISAVGGGGGGGLTAAAPYLTDGIHYYVPSTGYQVTKPSSSPAFIGTTPTVTAGANGNILLFSLGQTWVWLSATTSSEVVLRTFTADGGVASGWGGVWLWDSTNNFIYSFYPSNNGANTITWFFQKWSYNGSGAVSFSSTISSGGVGLYGWSDYAHLKMSVSGSTLSAAISLDGGSTFITVHTASSVGTISKGGYAVNVSATANIMSLKVV